MGEAQILQEAAAGEPRWVEVVEAERPRHLAQEVCPILAGQPAPRHSTAGSTAYICTQVSNSPFWLVTGSLTQCNRRTQHTGLGHRSIGRTEQHNHCLHRAGFLGQGVQVRRR